MAIDTIRLPKNPKALARVIAQHIERERAMNSWMRTKWKLAWFYLNGVRNFNVLNLTTGNVRGTYLDKEGNLEFQATDLLAAIDRVQGRIAAMDLRPMVVRQGFSLSGIRERSIAQIIADAGVNNDHLEKVKTQFSHLFTTLGCVGLVGSVLDHPTIGLTSDLEVVHPRELMPFPTIGMDHLKQRGVVRRRTVPLSFLEERIGKRVLAGKADEMDAWKLQIGQNMSYDENDARDLSGAATERSGSVLKGRVNPEDEYADVVRINELWLEGPQGILERYVVTSGDATLVDQDVSELGVTSPIQVARFFETGTFYGAGMFDLLFAQCRQLELMLKSLYNNVRSIDRYGFLVVPQGSFNERTAMKEVGGSLRVVQYQPDALTENFRPFVVQPFNSGDVPGKVAMMSKQMIDELNPIRDIIREKGRVDSASGLQLLDEALSKAMTTPTRAIQQTFGGVYKYVVSTMAGQLAVSPRPMPVTRLTLDLAGAIIDPDKSEVSFPTNPIPDVSRLTFTVRETNPRSMVARKQEALQYLQLGIMSPGNFVLAALNEGWDIPGWLTREQGAYESGIRDILTLYGDGITPGEITVTPHTAAPDIQIRVLQSFMVGPAMRRASPEVQDQFLRYKQFLELSMGNVLPEGVPTPDQSISVPQQ